MKYIITETQFSTIQTNNPGSIIRMVEKLYNSMDMEGICELDVGYDEEDNNFHCYLIIDRDWYTKNPLDKDLKNIKIRKYTIYTYQLQVSINLKIKLLLISK